MHNISVKNISVKKILLASTAVVTWALSAGFNEAAASYDIRQADMILRTPPARLIAALEAQNGPGDPDIVAAKNHLGNPGPGNLAPTVQGFINRLNPNIPPVPVTLGNALDQVEAGLNAARIPMVGGILGATQVLLADQTELINMEVHLGELGLVAPYAPSDRITALNNQLSPNPGTTTAKLAENKNLIGVAGPTLLDDLESISNSIGGGGVTLQAKVDGLKTNELDNAHYLGIRGALEAINPALTAGSTLIPANTKDLLRSELALLFNAITLNQAHLGGGSNGIIPKIGAGRAATAADVTILDIIAAFESRTIKIQ